MQNKIIQKVKSHLTSKGGLVLLGQSASYNWISDPSRLLFSLSRYKFVSRMFKGFDRVLEVGCADGMGSYLVSKYVSSLLAVDIDESLIESAKKTVGVYCEDIDFQSGDITDGTFLKSETFDGIFMLDVLEHIPQVREEIFLQSVVDRLNPHGSVIIGVPSYESQLYASEMSKLGHVNCKTQQGLRDLCERFFRSVYMFGANDEIINTGFPEMQHYRLAVCSNKR